MTNQEAISYLCNLRVAIGRTEHQALWHYEQALAEIIDLLSEPERQGRWIPCSERLPDKEKETYWICTDTEHQCECRWTNNVYGFGESDRWGWSIFDIPYYTKVSAWMPLPEPYKAGE